jgi:transposase
VRAKPWEVPDAFWQRIEPLLPRKPRRFRYPGRKPLDDRRVLQGILLVASEFGSGPRVRR